MTIEQKKIHYSYLNRVTKGNTWTAGRPSICKYYVTNKYWSMNSKLTKRTPSFRWQP